MNKIFDTHNITRVWRFKVCIKFNKNISTKIFLYLIPRESLLFINQYTLGLYFKQSKVFFYEVKKIEQKYFLLFNATFDVLYTYRDLEILSLANLIQIVNTSFDQSLKLILFFLLQMWMYSLGRALLDTTPRVAALTGTVSVSPSSALQSVLAAMTEPDPRRRASLMNLLDVSSQFFQRIFYSI